MNTNFKQSSAYELADELLRDNTQLTVKAANMLRQQADRIAELEKQGEPVAWMNGNEICPEIGYEATITMEHPKDLGWIPLYTTPQTKPLSDEEIILISKNCDMNHVLGLIDFARAIEERHGIK